MSCMTRAGRFLTRITPSTERLTVPSPEPTFGRGELHVNALRRNAESDGKTTAKVGRERGRRFARHFSDVLHRRETRGRIFAGERHRYARDETCHYPRFGLSEMRGERAREIAKEGALGLRRRARCGGKDLDERHVGRLPF